MPSEYEVGYKRPPMHTRFKNGRSGNPNGRPKGTKNLTADLAEELQERVLVKEGAKQRQISKQRAMIKSLMAKAMKGDTRATTVIYTMMLRPLDIIDRDERLIPEPPV